MNQYEIYFDFGSLELRPMRNFRQTDLHLCKPDVQHLSRETMTMAFTVSHQGSNLMMTVLTCEFSRSFLPHGFIPWNWILINWTMDSRHTIMWVPPETITPDLIQFSRYFLARRDCRLNWRHPVEWQYVLSWWLLKRPPYNSMGYCKKDVTPSLMHWSYVFLALTHRHVDSRRRLC